MSRRSPLWRLPYAGEAEVYDAVLITTLASIWAEVHNESDMNKAIAALLNGKSTSQGGWTDGMIASYYQESMAGKDTSRILGVQR